MRGGVGHSGGRRRAAAEDALVAIQRIAAQQHRSRGYAHSGQTTSTSPPPVPPRPARTTTAPPAAEPTAPAPPPPRGDATRPAPPLALSTTTPTGPVVTNTPTDTVRTLEWYNINIRTLRRQIRAAERQRTTWILIFGAVGLVLIAVIAVLIWLAVK